MTKVKLYIFYFMIFMTVVAVFLRLFLSVFLKKGLRKNNDDFYKKYFERRIKNENE